MYYCDIIHYCIKGLQVLNYTGRHYLLDKSEHYAQFSNAAECNFGFNVKDAVVSSASFSVRC